MSRIVERLIIEADQQRPGAFTAQLESGEIIVTGTRQPLVDGARALLAGGFDPATPLTMRHAGKGYDSFKPEPIGKWARWTYKESDRDGLQKARWMAPELHQRAEKSGPEPLPGVQPPPEYKSLPRRWATQ